MPLNLLLTAPSSSTRLRAVALGDSTVAGSMKDSLGTTVLTTNSYTFPNKVIGEEQMGPQSWFNTACLLSGGRLLNVHNAGVGSDVSRGCLARFDTDVTAYRPDVVFISGGIHNDFTSSVPTATSRANLVGMIRKARAAGITPILVTVYPENNTFAASMRNHNAWLKDLASGRAAGYSDISGLLVVDPYSAVVDPTSSTGAWVPANTADGTHASPAGAVLAGNKVLADLGGLLRGNPAGGPFAATDSVAGSPNLLHNGLMLTDGNADGIPDFWGPSASSVITDAAIIGKAQSITASGAAVQSRQSASVDGTTVRVGDRLKWAGWVKATAAAGSLAWNLSITQIGAVGYLVQPANSTGVDFPWCYFECETVVRPSVTAVTIAVNSTAGSGTLFLAQQSLINMSLL